MRLFFYGEIVLMLILVPAYAMLAVTGVVGFVTDSGDYAAELVPAGAGAFWCNALWRDIRRQRRRFADPRYSS